MDRRGLNGSRGLTTMQFVLFGHTPYHSLLGDHPHASVTAGLLDCFGTTHSLLSSSCIVYLGLYPTQA